MALAHNAIEARLRNGTQLTDSVIAEVQAEIRTNCPEFFANTSQFGTVSQPFGTPLPGAQPPPGPAPVPGRPIGHTGSHQIQPDGDPWAEQLAHQKARAQDRAKPIVGQQPPASG